MGEGDGGAGRSGYAVAGTIFLLGAFISAVLFGLVLYNIFSLDDQMERVPIPGTAEVTLQETGRYTVFYEWQASMPEREFRTNGDPPQVMLEVTHVETDESVPVTGDIANINYDFWTRSGDSIASFPVDEPGTYRITSEYANSAMEEDAMLALGEGLGTTIIFTVIAALGTGAFFCGTVGVALVIVVITLIRRT